MVVAFYIGLILLALLIWATFAYHRFAHYQRLADETWAGIVAGLRRRTDLIPDLLAAVRRLRGADPAQLENVEQACRHAIDAGSPREHADAQDALQGTLFSLFASLEPSPHVWSDPGFLEVQQALAQAEDEMYQPRKLYNATVEELNKEIASFPKNLLAMLFRVRVREYYETAEEAERDAPRVVA